MSKVERQNSKLDGKDVPHSLFSLVKRPIKELEAKGQKNSTIAFFDNASAIRGLGRPAPVICPVALRSEVNNFE